MPTPTSSIAYQEAGITGTTLVKADIDSVLGQKVEVVQIVGPSPAYTTAGVDSTGRLAFSVSDTLGNGVMVLSRNPSSADFGMAIRSSDLRDLILSVDRLTEIVVELSHFFHQKG